MTDSAKKLANLQRRIKSAHALFQKQPGRRTYEALQLLLAEYRLQADNGFVPW